ncbi:MAG: hypothetical protein Kow0079_07140 [Vicingaceae bacterium]
MEEEFEDKLFLNLVHRFEEMLQDKRIKFFDVDQIEDLFEYYLSKDNRDNLNILIQIGLTQHPNSVEILIKKAQLQFFKNKINDALKTLETCENIEPNNAEVMVFKAELYSFIQNSMLALKYYLKAAEIDDKSEIIDHIYFCISQEYSKLGEIKNAIYFLQKSLLSNPENAFNLMLLGEYYIDFNLPVKGIKFLEYFIDQHPESSMAWFTLGKVYYSYDFFEEAIHAFDIYETLHNDQTELEFNENVIDAKLYKGLCLFHLKQYQAALQYLYDVVALDKDNDEALGYIGEIYEQMNENYLAGIFFKKSLQINPENSNIDTYLNYTYVLIKRNDYEAAYKVISDASKISDNNYEIKSLQVAIKDYLLFNKPFDAFAFRSELDKSVEDDEFVLKENERKQIAQFFKCFDYLKEFSKDYLQINSELSPNIAITNAVLISEMVSIEAAIDYLESLKSLQNNDLIIKLLIYFCFEINHHEKAAYYFDKITNQTPENDAGEPIKKLNFKTLSFFGELDKYLKNQ